MKQKEMRDKLAELIEKSINPCEHAIGLHTGKLYVTSLEMAEYLIANGVVVMGKGEWISVKDRLPEFGENVLTYSPEEKVSPKYCNAYIGKNGEWIERSFFERPLGKVTHWMPLPEPPEVE